MNRHTPAAHSIITAILFCLIFTGCTYSGMDDDYQSIDPELKTYVDKFVNEANLRGIDVDIWNLKIAFKKLQPGEVGIAYSETNQIYITEGLKGRWPECTVFHEMAHLYLRRDHDDSRLPNKYKKSIMCSTGIVDIESDQKVREYYLNELFDPNTPCPEWAN